MLSYFGESISIFSTTLNNLVIYISNHINIDELLISDDDKSTKSTDTEENKSTTSEKIKCLLPYENTDIKN